MATASALAGVGVPPEVAKRVGYQQVPVTTTAATQGSAGGLLIGPGNKIVTATVASAGHAITLPTAAAIGDEIIVNNVTANAAVLFPHSGGNVNGETTDASMAIAAQGSTNCVVRAVKLSATRWGVFSAVVS
jgi:hypothetical protein